MRLYAQHRGARLRGTATDRRVLVSYRHEDAGFGGRLYDDLARRLGAERVVRDGDGGAVLAVLGPDWPQRFRTTDGDRVRDAVARALADGRRVVPILLEGAVVPDSTSLPEELSALGGVEPIRAVDEYWDQTVDRVISRLPPSRRPRLLRILRRYPKISLGGAIASVVAILGALHQFGYIGPYEPERGTLAIKPQVTAGITRAQFLTDYARPGQPPPDNPGVAVSDEGYVFSIDVTLEHARSNRYSLRWTMQTATMGRNVRSFENVLGDEFGAAEASRIHTVWVPCPLRDNFDFVAEFALVDEKRPDAPLDTAVTDRRHPLGCRTIEP